MNVRSNTARAPVMNVTPLVDVVLVLLIIFMVLTPLLAKRFWVHTPRQEQREVERRELQEPNSPLVLRIGADSSIAINGAALTIDELEQRLPRIFAARSDHVLFFDADDAVSYGYAVEVLDRARAGGAVTIAALTKSLAAPPEPLP